MRSIAIVVALLLAGCAEPTPETPAPEPEAPAHEDMEALEMTVTGPSVVREPTVKVNVTVNHAAIVTLSYDHAQWPAPTPVNVSDKASFGFDVPFGHTLITVVADDGRMTVNETLLIVREASVTVKVVYRGDVGLSDHDDTFWYDMAALPSLATGAYTGCQQGHPGTPNVHDAMVAWEAATGNDVGYGACGSFGVPVNDINGHANPGYWCFEVNGEASETGITLAEVAPGDEIVWDDCALVLG